MPRVRQRPLALTPQVLALALAGGQGRRMGGADKGLQPWGNSLLIDAVLAGIAAQTRPVQALAISANRNLPAYAQRAAVLSDWRPNWPGPLAGVEAGLAHLQTQFGPSQSLLWTLPCDVPQFPAHTLQQLLTQQGLEPDKPVWVRFTAIAGQEGRDHPACALWPLACAPTVSAALDAGQHAVLRLLRDLGGQPVDISANHPQDFNNINTLSDLCATAPPPVI